MCCPFNSARQFNLYKRAGGAHLSLRQGHSKCKPWRRAAHRFLAAEHSIPPYVSLCVQNKTCCHHSS
ncbi:hypothetical protein V5799_020544 [Amblyomma americanum]|uniref:Uncharacterized protein n=1 Tax=Amblyomma americanum TaxID=6943 RepID=A0AAQ4ETT1_AMBAM